ncbi:MAG: hypothetical protein ACXVHS_11095 [Methanobacterium sp.]
MRFERLLILGIIILLSLLCFNYASNHIYYTDSSVVDLLYGSKELNFTSGPVTDIYNDGFEIYGTNLGNYFQVKTKLKVEPENYVYILGSLIPDNEIIPQKIMIDKEDDSINVIYRSIFGLIIFLFIFLRYWRFNFKKILFIKLKKTKACKNRRFWRR